MNEFKGKRVAILGLARQGTALARYLARAGADVVVSDILPAEKLSRALAELKDLTIEYALGGHPESLLEGADLLCLSGGVPTGLPIVRAARQRGIPLSNEAQIFLKNCAAPVIGITGSAGKTTTTALVGRMLQEGGVGSKVWVGGNIGNPLIGDLDRIAAQDWIVMELSSYQLEITWTSPDIAAVLNITPDHLDRHETMAVYSEAKAHILDFQQSEDMAVLGLDDPGSSILKGRARGRLAWFSVERTVEQGALLRGEHLMIRFDGREREVGGVSEIALRGRHNLLNVLAACAIAGSAAVEPEAMRRGITGFAGVAHRLEFVREVNGARWYDDSIATSPERACAAIQSFQEPLVLLAGGRDKNLPWSKFGELARKRVRHLVLFGEARELIASAVGAWGAGGAERGAAGAAPGEAARQGGALQSVSLASNLAEAVEQAAGLARPGDVVLLSPGGTSFDEFIDFAERGDRFKEFVNAL